MFLIVVCFVVIPAINTLLLICSLIMWLQIRKELKKCDEWDKSIDLWEDYISRK